MVTLVSSQKDVWHLLTNPNFKSNLNYSKLNKSRLESIPPDKKT